MTCIVGVVDEEAVFMGADSLVTNGWNVSNTNKIYRNGEYLIGGSGYLRACQLVGLAPLPSPPTLAESLLDFMITDFSTTARQFLREHGQLEKEKEIESQRNSFLVAVRGHLFKISSDFCVTERDCGYDAIGYGEEYALGVLHFTAKDGYEPEGRIYAALDAAEDFCGSVRHPFRITRL